MTHVIERENRHLFSRAVLSNEARKAGPPQNNLDEKIITVLKEIKQIKMTSNRV